MIQIKKYFYHFDPLSFDPVSFDLLLVNRIKSTVVNYTCSETNDGEYVLLLFPGFNILLGLVLQPIIYWKIDIQISWSAHYCLLLGVWTLLLFALTFALCTLILLPPLLPSSSPHFCYIYYFWLTKVCSKLSLRSKNRLELI